MFNIFNSQTLDPVDTRPHTVPTGTPIGTSDGQNRMPDNSISRYERKKIMLSRGVIIAISTIMLAGVICMYSYVSPRRVVVHYAAPRPVKVQVNNPRIDPNNQFIPLAMNKKNFTLKNIDPCANYLSHIRAAGYPTFLLYPFAAPYRQRDIDRISTHPIYPGSSIKLRGYRACFWMFANKSYVTIQRRVYSSIPKYSEIAYIYDGINDVNDPLDNPRHTGESIVYSLVRFDIKGYVAYIASSYDDAFGAKECVLDFPPYLIIGATGKNCNQVRKLAYLILP